MEKYHYTYKVYDEQTGQFYIGSRTSKVEPTLDIAYKGSMKRWKPNKDKLKKEIICLYDTRQIANKAEKFMILLQKKYNKDKLCMNFHIPDIGFCNEGTKFSDETKNKMSLALKGKPKTQEHKNKLKGRVMSDVNRLKISMANTGRIFSDETREKLSLKAKHRSPEVLKKISESNKGKKMSEEARQKISKARKNQPHPMIGKKHSNEAKAKMSLVAKQRPPMTEDTKIKISNIKKGKKTSEETKAKQSISHLGYKPKKESIELQIQTRKNNILNKCNEVIDRFKELIYLNINEVDIINQLNIKKEHYNILIKSLIQ